MPCNGYHFSDSGSEYLILILMIPRVFGLSVDFSFIGTITVHHGVHATKPSSSRRRTNHPPPRSYGLCSSCREGVGPPSLLIFPTVRAALFPTCPNALWDRDPCGQINRHD